MGGAEKLALTLGACQLRMGHEVLMGFLFGGGPILEQAKDEAVPTRIYGFRNAFDIFAVRSFWKDIRQYDPDVIHCHMPSVGSFLSLRFRKKALIVVHEHGGTVFGMTNWRNRINGAIIRKLQGKMDGFIAVSEITKDAMVKKLSILPNRIVVIPNGIDLSEFRRDVDRKALRAGLGIDDRTFVCGTVGRLTEGKDIETFLRVAASVRNRLSGARFLIAGDGPCKEELEREAVKLGLGKSISFLGTRRDVPQLLAALDVFVLTSRHESFGIVIIEAMARGLPVVAFRTGGISEVIVGGSGIMVGLGEIGQMADKVVDIARDEGKRITLSRAALDRAQEFDISRIALRIQGLYEEMCYKRLGEFQSIKQGAPARPVSLLSKPKQVLSIIHSTHASLSAFQSAGLLDRHRSLLQEYSRHFDVHVYSSDTKDFSAYLGVQHKPMPWLPNRFGWKHLCFYLWLVIKAPGMRGVIRVIGSNIPTLAAVKLLSRCPMMVTYQWDYSGQTMKNERRGLKYWLAPLLERAALMPAVSSSCHCSMAGREGA